MAIEGSTVAVGAAPLEVDEQGRFRGKVTPPRRQRTLHRHPPRPPEERRALLRPANRAVAGPAAAEQIDRGPRQRRRPRRRARPRRRRRRRRRQRPPRRQRSLTTTSTSAPVVAVIACRRRRRDRSSSAAKWEWASGRSAIRAPAAVATACTCCSRTSGPPCSACRRCTGRRCWRSCCSAGPPEQWASLVQSTHWPPALQCLPLVQLLSSPLQLPGQAPPEHLRKPAQAIELPVQAPLPLQVRAWNSSPSQASGQSVPAGRLLAGPAAVALAGVAARRCRWCRTCSWGRRPRRGSASRRPRCR